MRYRLQFVHSYDAQSPIFYTEGQLADYPLDPTLDILNVSRSIFYRTTVYQGGSDFFRAGALSLRLDATQLRWMPGIGYMQSDRDHIVTVTTDLGHKLWRGYASEVKLTQDAGADWKFTSEYNRLNDVSIMGDSRDTRGAVPAQEILDEVRGQLPIFPQVDATGWFDVYRPTDNTSARDYVAKLLAAQGKILVFDDEARLEVRDIAPRQAAFDSAVGLTIRDADLIKCQVLDDKRYMFNVVDYTPFGGEQTIFTGELETYTFPGNHIFRYGRRQIGMDFDHLGAGDARLAAEQWQGRLIRPKRRVTIELADPQRQILLLDRIRLELDNVLTTPQPLWGDFVVSAIKINTAKDTVEIESEEIL